MSLPTSHYHPPTATPWTGRRVDPALGIQYWHQAVRLIDLNEGLPRTNLPGIALLGYACDEGVRRNQGRPGAARGPETIRQRLAKLAYHHAPDLVMDAGDIRCDNGDLEAAQRTLSAAVAMLLGAGVFPIVLGGGHDVAYGHFGGIRAAHPGAQLGIVNVDAHFDLRPVRTRPNSGTPFRQILIEATPDARLRYAVVGIQRASNPRELFDLATHHGVLHVLNEHCRPQDTDAVAERLDDFLADCPHYYLTIDLDGVSSAYAPGVSAPSPLGLEPRFVAGLIRRLFATGRVVAVDFAELNPEFDRDHATANLVARWVDTVVEACP